MNDDNVFDEYSNLKDFEADAVVIVLGENIHENEHTQDELADKFSELISYLRKGKVKFPFLSRNRFYGKSRLCARRSKKRRQN